MADTLTAADRTLLFDWLASVFSREPDAATVAVLRGEDGARLIAALATIGPLAGPATDLAAAVRTIHDREGDDDGAAIALAARFGTLFLGAAGPDGAHPHASIYLEGRTHGAAADRAAAFLADHGMGVSDDVHQPADHLAITLAALGALAGREAEADDATAEALRSAQTAFVEAEMLPWVPRFRERVERDDPDGYYAAAARLAEGVLDMVAGRTAA